jgi:phosphopantothenoylcysteine decarboxylase/phosphopantothenoylcysteine decarboxylase/phosphopantothenate--cysteine ligase
MKNIILGITGSIAAYKAADIASSLTKDGYNVHAIMTESATKFITPLTLQTLTKNKVHTNQFEESVPTEIEHIDLAKKADLLLIAPATANFIAKVAAGMADDMLTSVILASRNTPILIAPAMNTAMYENLITKRNIKTLCDLGFSFIEPEEAMLACGDFGKGALAETSAIIEKIKRTIP